MKELALNILDIAQNSLSAKASEITLRMKESDLSNELIVEITDNGIGINEKILKDVDDPYTTSRTTRNIGMGIPLLKFHSELAGGSFQIKSKIGKGTSVKAKFQKDHIDRQPIGDLTGVLRILLSADPNVNFKYQHTTDKGSFEISSFEIKSELGLNILNDNKLLKQLEELVRNNLKELESKLN